MRCLVSFIFHLFWRGNSLTSKEVDNDKDIESKRRWLKPETFETADELLTIPSSVYFFKGVFGRVLSGSRSHFRNVFPPAKKIASARWTIAEFYCSHFAIRNKFCCPWAGNLLRECCLRILVKVFWQHCNYLFSSSTQLSHVAGHIDLGGQYLPFSPPWGVQEFYTRNRYIAKLLLSIIL